jgi:predicted transposase/invertase (TIGR01784 family)
VIPVLFYTGKRSPYPYSTRWLDEFDDPALAGTLYSGAFPLVDVTVIPDDDIAGHRSMAALTLLQKHIHQRDLAELVDRLAPILLAGYLSSSQVISLVHYIPRQARQLTPKPLYANWHSVCRNTETHS